MNIIELVREKSFLGQEFLTWLWWQSEEETGFTLADGKTLNLALGERMSLSPLMGVPGSRVAMSGPDRQLNEARQGLMRGKLLDSLRLCLLIDNEEYWLTLDSPLLCPRAIRLPASAGTEEGDADAQAWERIALLENLCNALDALFKAYLQQRMERIHNWPELAAWSRAASSL